MHKSSLIERARVGAAGRLARARRRAHGKRAAGADFDLEGLESKLLWIWGSPRSGASWLLQLLSHPLIPDPEQLLGFRLPKQQISEPYDCVPVDETFISNHISPAFADPRIEDGHWVPGSLHNFLSWKPAYAFSDAYADTWRPELRRLILARLRAVLTHADRAGVELTRKPTVAIKETNGSHASDLMMSLMPQAKMLLLIRDPRDVVDSLLSAYQPGGFMAETQGRPVETPAERAETVAWAARLWACNTDTSMRAAAAHTPERARTVRYEDLLADTVGELTALYRWLGLPRDPRKVEAIVAARSFAKLPETTKGPLSRNRRATPGLWRERLEPEEQATVNETCGPLLASFGYEL